MRQENFSYAQADKNFYEAMRINKGSSTEWSAAREGNALIDVSKTPLNYELVPHHEALNPNDYHKHNRGQGIAEYHKKVTGRTARMNGKEEQRSKAVGCIITLPKDYLKIDYGLTEEEYNAIAKVVENGKRDKNPSKEYQSAMKKIQAYEYTEEENKAIDAFFRAALVAWMRVAGIREEDLLYAVIHKDESAVHAHFMALPSIVEIDAEDPDKSKIRFSTSKYNNRTTGYYDNFHTRVIEEMKGMGIDASGLLNGATKGKGFSPADLNRDQREESVRRSIENHILSQRNQQLADRAEMAEIHTLKAEGKKAVAEQELKILQHKKIANQSLSKKEIQAHKKELQRIQKRDGNPQITQLEYDKLLQSTKMAQELEDERCELAEQKRNFQQEVKKAAEAMFPEELKRVRKDKEFCDEWLARAKELEQLQYVNFTREMELTEKEEELAHRKRTLDAEVEYRAQQKSEELLQNQKVSLLGLLLDIFALFISAIVGLISVFLPVAVMEKVTELADNFRFDIEKVFEEPEIEHTEQGE